MKKILTLALALAMVLSLAACVGSTPAATTAATTAGDTTAAPEAGDTTAAPAAADVKIAVVCDASGQNDNGYNQSAVEGAKELAEQYGMLCPSISIEVSAKNAAEAGADGIIITGATIGEETPIEMIARAKKVVKIPVFAGSGVKPGNVREQLDIADGCIVGSSFKKGGVLTNPIDYTLARELIEAKG